MAQLETQATAPVAFRFRPRLLATGSLALMAFVSTGVLAGQGIARIATSAHNATGDFLASYVAGTLVRDGHPSMLYDGASQRWLQTSTYSGTFDQATPFQLPAFAAWIFAPLSQLPFTQAYFTWIAINMVALGALLVTLSRHLEHVPDAQRRIFLAVFAVSIPVVTSVLYGQVDLFVFAGLLGGYLLMRQNRGALSGLALSLALLQPPMLLGVVAMLILWRQWNTLGVLACVAGAVLAVPAFVGGGEARAALGIYADGGGLDIAADSMANWRGFVASAAGRDDAAVWLPGLGLIGGAAFALAVPHWRRASFGAAPADQSFALAALLPLLVAPQVYVHHLVLLFLPLAIALRGHFRPEGDNWHDDDRLADASALLLLCFAALFAPWFVGVQLVSLTPFAVMLAFCVCCFRWPGDEPASNAPESAMSLTASLGHRYDPGGRHP